MNVNSLIRRTVKAAVLPVGAVHPRRAGDVVILLYHRVGRGDREIDLPVDLFEEHLRILRAGGHLRSLDDALSDGRGGVVLTMDDGYRDFHDYALPILERHGVPALLYLATGLVAGEQDSDEAADALTWPMLRRAVATGLVTVGSHTHSHANLARASEDEAEAEMRRSAGLIEERLGTACRHFAYPWGVPSDGAERAARRVFVSAALGDWRTNRREAMDRYRLGRTPVLRSDGRLFFRAKVAGALDSEALAYRVARRGPWRDSEQLIAPEVTR